MREYIIDKANAGKRLDRWLSAELPALPLGTMQKFIRLKRIKINRKAAQRDTRLNEGDLLQLYINDEYFEKPTAVDRFLSGYRYQLSILYEDAHMMLVDKRAGVVAHPDDQEKVHTLINHVKAYLYQKGEWDSMDAKQFAPVLCNRIDRFTGGIVIIAKTEAAMRVLNQKIRECEIEKYYLCIVHGHMPAATGLIDNYILKSEPQKRVSVLKYATPGAQRAQTRYKALSVNGALSLLECELLTGRTHQIRAQLAAMGHPLLGDNQYGNPRQNERYHRSYQALYSYKLTFRFQSDAGVLNELNGRSWQVRHVPFAEEYFPEIKY